MKNLLTSTVICCFTSASFAAPVFQPVNDYPTVDSYTLTSGYNSCRYQYGDDLATVTYPNFAMLLTRNLGKQRISGYDCSVVIDNSRVLKNVILTGASSASFHNVTTAPECRFVAVSSKGRRVNLPMDAIYVVPNGVVAQYIVEDVDALLTGVKLKRAFIQCDALDDVSWVRVDSVGPSYY